MKTAAVTKSGFDSRTAHISAFTCREEPPSSRDILLNNKRSIVMQKNTGDGRGNPENLVPQFAEIAHALKGVDLPQDKQGLIEAAENNNTDGEVMQLIEALPEREYNTMADVIAAAGEIGFKENE
jgi:hypothetical protein